MVGPDAPLAPAELPSAAGAAAPALRAAKGSAFVTEFGALAGPQHGPRRWPSAALWSEEPAKTEVTVVLRPEKPRQHILGFGAAMTESAAQVIYSSPERDTILDDLFLPMDRGGAGFSCLRVCIGSSDFSLDAVEFSRSRGMELLVPVLRAAKRRNPQIALLASQWSAPAYMKTSGSLNGGTLKDECIQPYCHYLLKALLFFERQGLHISAMTLQNEPFCETDYPSMSLTVQQQAALARELVPLLRRNGLSTLVLGHDHNFSHKAQAVELLKLCGDILDGTAWHAYEGKETSLADEVIQSNGIFFTEQTAHSVRPRDADFLKDMEWMLQHVLLGPLLVGSRCALSWNLALDRRFGPRLPGAPRNCRGVVEVPDIGKHERSPELFVLAHACHATSAPEGQGAWRIFGKGSSPVVGCAAFRSACGSTVGALLQNRGAAAAAVLLRCGEQALARLLVPPKSLLSVSGLELPQELRPKASLSSSLRPKVPVDAYCLPGAMFALRSRCHGTYLATHGHHNVLYQSGTREPGDWERWTAVEAGERSVALRSCFGSFLGLDGQRRLVLVKSWFEKLTFTIMAMPDGSVAFYSDFGCLQMPEEGREPRLTNSRIGAWEVFEITSPCRLPRTAFALHSVSQGGLLSASASSSAPVVLTSGKKPGDDECWVAVEVSAQTSALRSWHGTFLGCDEHGCLQQVSSLRAALALAPFALGGGAVGLDSDRGSLQLDLEPGDGPARLICAASRAREALLPIVLGRLPPSLPLALRSAEHESFFAAYAGGTVQTLGAVPGESERWTCDYRGVRESLPDAFFLRAGSGSYLSVTGDCLLTLSDDLAEAVPLELVSYGDGTISLVACIQPRGSIVLPSAGGEPRLEPRPSQREDRLFVQHLAA